MTNTSRRRSLGLFANLVKAIDWYDTSLQSVLASKNMTYVNRTQSIILLHIAQGTNKPSDIAVEMGTTRQNIHAMAGQLIDKGILKLEKDTADGRARMYVFTEESQELRDEVVKVLKYLDKKLAERIGPDALKALKEALSMDWGDRIAH